MNGVWNDCLAVMFKFDDRVINVKRCEYYFGYCMGTIF